MKNSNDIIGNRTRHLPICSAVPQPTAPPRAPRYSIIIIMNVRTGNKFYEGKFFHEIVILLVWLPTEPSYLQLDLSYNALSFLHEEVTHWESLESTNLQGNPWDCTCRLQWVLDKVLPLMYNSSQDLLYELRLVKILYWQSFEEKKSESSVYVIVFWFGENMWVFERVKTLRKSLVLSYLGMRTTFGSTTLLST
jgi:hypothetical protein